MDRDEIERWRDSHDRMRKPGARHLLRGPRLTRGHPSSEGICTSPSGDAFLLPRRGIKCSGLNHPRHLGLPDLMHLLVRDVEHLNVLRPGAAAVR